MKGWPATVVVVAVAIAVVISIWAFVGSRAPSREYELRAMEKSVDELRAEVREMRAVVRELRETLAAEATREDVVPEGGTALGPVAGEVNVEPVDVVLEVKAGGVCVLDGRAVERDELQAGLKKVLAANPAMTLIVRPDETVPMVEVYRVLDEAHEAGIYRISLATSAPEESAGPE